MRSKIETRLIKDNSLVLFTIYNIKINRTIL